MAIDRGYDGDPGRGRGHLMKVTSLALGIAMFGTVGLSGALAQDDPGAGSADAESMVESIIAEIFGELFGGGVVDDDAAMTGGGDLNIGGSTGSTVTMGGSGGSVTMDGGSGGGVTVGDNYGG